MLKINVPASVMNGRCLLNSLQPDEDEDPVSHKPGICSYGRVWGWLLVIFGFSISVKDINGHDFYLNKKSLVKWLRRHGIASPEMDNLAQDIDSVFQGTIPKPHSQLPPKPSNDSAAVSAAIKEPPSKLIVDLPENEQQELISRTRRNLKKKFRSEYDSSKSIKKSDVYKKIEVEIEQRKASSTKKAFIAAYGWCPEWDKFFQELQQRKIIQRYILVKGPAFSECYIVKMSPKDDIPDEVQKLFTEPFARLIDLNQMERFKQDFKSEETKTTLYYF